MASDPGGEVIACCVRVIYRSWAQPSPWRSTVCKPVARALPLGIEMFEAGSSGACRDFAGERLTLSEALDRIPGRRRFCSSTISSSSLDRTANPVEASAIDGGRPGVQAAVLAPDPAVFDGAERRRPAVAREVGIGVGHTDLHAGVDQPGQAALVAL